MLPLPQARKEAAMTAADLDGLTLEVGHPVTARVVNGRLCLEITMHVYGPPHGIRRVGTITTLEAVGIPLAWLKWIEVENHDTREE